MMFLVLCASKKPGGLANYADQRLGTRKAAWNEDCIDQDVHVVAVREELGVHVGHGASQDDDDEIMTMYGALVFRRKKTEVCSRVHFSRHNNCCVQTSMVCGLQPHVSLVLRF
jgi:hypothetical protein